MTLAISNGLPARSARWPPTRTASATTRSAGSPSRPSPAARASRRDTLGGINGWLVTKGSPKEAVEFLKFFVSLDVADAAGGEATSSSRWSSGADTALSAPSCSNIAQNLARSKYHQNFYDQMLGPSVGRVVNDVDRRDRRRQHDAEGGRQGRSRTPGSRATDVRVSGILASRASVPRLARLARRRPLGRRSLATCASASSTASHRAVPAAGAAALHAVRHPADRRGGLVQRLQLERLRHARPIGSASTTTATCSRTARSAWRCATMS